MSSPRRSETAEATKNIACRHPGSRDIKPSMVKVACRHPGSRDIKPSMVRVRSFFMGIKRYKEYFVRTFTDILFEIAVLQTNAG